MANRMTSAHFVGRSAQLAELEAALRDAAARRPSLALIAGESGVGKSRLADELVGRARDQGARVLWGDCVELGEGELPYAPLLGALRPLVRDPDPAVAALPPALRAGLDSLLPGLGTTSGGEPVTQARVFEGLLALLETLGEDGPVVLVIEDLHWSDSSTRHFLSFLARSMCGAPLLVVGTYRSDELHRRHPLRPLLAELSRDPTTLMVELPPFTREEMGEQLEGILAAAPDPGLVERMYSRSEGNALFTEEILAAGLDGRGALPPTLRDALMLRVERLSPGAQDLLRWLACQPSADHELLTAVVKCEPAELLDSLREATASQIVVILPHGAYAFRHALLREVVHDDLLPGERTEMHAALARALEVRIDAGDAGAFITAQAAHHWQAAGDQPAALTASVRAAAAAERVNAFPEAHSLLERALELWDRVPEPERLAGAPRVEVLQRAASAADAAGVPARQEALLRRALELVDEKAEPRHAAKLLDSLSHSLWNLHRQDEAVEVLDRALALLPADEQSSAQAKVLATKAKRRMLQARFGEAEEAARQSLVIARAVGDRESESRALNALGVSVGGQGDVDAGVEALRDALAIAQDGGWRPRRARPGSTSPISSTSPGTPGRRSTWRATACARARPTRTAPPIGSASRWPSSASTSASGARPRRRSRGPAAGTRDRRWPTGSPSAACWTSAAVTSTPPPPTSRASPAPRGDPRNRSSSHPPGSSPPSWPGGGATSSRPASRSTTRSTRSSTAPTTSSGSPPWPPRASAWRATPASWHATGAIRTPRVWWPPARTP